MYATYVITPKTMKKYYGFIFIELNVGFSFIFFFGFFFVYIYANEAAD